MTWLLAALLSIGYLAGGYFDFSLEYFLTDNWIGGGWLVLYEVLCFALLALCLYFLCSLCCKRQNGWPLLVPSGVILLAGLLESLRWFGGFSVATFFAQRNSFRTLGAALLVLLIAVFLSIRRGKKQSAQTE